MRGVVRVPNPRNRALAPSTVRWLWTLPTNLLGHGAGLLLCGRPERLDSRATRAWLYVLPEGRRFSRWGAVALGHAVLASRRSISGERGRWVLAHELSHTRQHDWLGPAYIPAHVLFQLISIGLFLVRPVPGCTARHAHNPLERVFLDVPFDVLFRSDRRRAADPRVLDAFGV